MVGASFKFLYSPGGNIIMSLISSKAALQVWRGEVGDPDIIHFDKETAHLKKLLYFYDIDEPRETYNNLSAV